MNTLSLKNRDKTISQQLGELDDFEEQTKPKVSEHSPHAAQPHRPGASPKEMLTTVSKCYLLHALEKNSQPLHPNYREALLKSGNLAPVLLFRKCIQLTKHCPDVVARMEEIGFLTLRDFQSHMMFWTSIMTDAAFVARIELGRFAKKYNTIDEELERDAYGKAHPIVADVPLFDRAAMERELQVFESEMEDSLPEEKSYASSPEDVYEAVEAIQAWMLHGLYSLKVFSDRSTGGAARKYHNIDEGMPLKVKVLINADGDKVRIPIIKLDDYVDEENRKWALKQRERAESLEATTTMTREQYLAARG